MGCKVTLKELDSGDIVQYHIVGSAEASPSDFKISDESPVGKALIGNPVGNVVEVRVPLGLVKFEILAIAR